MPSPRALARLLALIACLACSPALHAQGAGNANEFVIADPANPPAAEAANLKRRLVDFVKLLPDGHQIGVRMRDFVGSPGEVIRYPEILTSLNADGQPDGPEIEYPNWYQHPIRITPYVAGRKHGVETYYFPGAGGKNKPVVKATMTWVDGVMNGPKHTYHPDGSLASVTHYVDGQTQGESKSYAKNGNILRVATFKDNKRHGLVTDYWPDREDVVKRQIHYVDGQVHGDARELYANGQVKWDVTFVDNRKNGVETHYTADGEVERVRYYLDGKQVDEAEYRAANP